MPKRRIVHEMPDDLYEIVAQALNRNIGMSAEKIIALLPDWAKSMVKSKELPNLDDGIRGIHPSSVFFDEVAELTKREKESLAAQFRR